MKTCNNCDNLGAEHERGQCIGIWCTKGHWDGITSKEDLEALAEPTDCEDWAGEEKK